MKRRSMLVCQFLENVSWQALEEYQDIIGEYMRRRPGIYALYRKRRLYYVGLARNLRGRLRSHLRDRHKGLWDRFSVYLTVGNDHMKELESLLLRIGKPTGNKQLGKFSSHAENLKRRFKKDVVAQLRRQARSVLGEDLGGEEEAPRKEPKGILGQYLLGRSAKLQRRYRGRLFRARVRRDGRIRFQRKLYRTPSDAAAAARGGKASNGWYFWHYERAPGDWVLLDELRR